MTDKKWSEPKGKDPDFERFKQKQKERKIPHFLYDRDGNMYEVMVQNHRKNTFNLITFRYDRKDFAQE